MKHENNTLQYYNENADQFISGTLEADMTDARNRFLEQLPHRAYILDFGCGSGRDTKAFLDAGYVVDAMDGSPELCKSASEYTGIAVRQLLFQDLDVKGVYDGIWTCASILHLPKAELVAVLERITAALKPKGFFYTSFKYGTFEGMRDGRHFTDFTEETLQEFWRNFSSLQIISLWITEDVRPGREEERWINLLAERS